MYGLDPTRPEHHYRSQLLGTVVDITITAENFYDRVAAIISLECKANANKMWEFNWRGLAWIFEHFCGIAYSHYTYKHMCEAIRRYGVTHLSDPVLLKQWLDFYFDTMNKIECTLKEETGVGFDACSNP